jgi:hypothetical protein
MRSRSTRIFFSIPMLLLAVIACNTPGQPAPTSTSRPLLELTLTSLVQTLTAQVSPVSVSTATPALYQSSTDTPFVPPTDTVIPSPVIPQVSVSSETNCRTGPSKYYKFVGKAEAGTTFTVVGKHPPTNYWIIRLADDRECWLWGQYATVEGDVNSLPEYSPPPFGRIEGELKTSYEANAGKIEKAFVDIGLGFDVYETGNDGKFVFEDVPIGEIKITIYHSYYIFPAFKVFVSAGQVTPVVKIGLVPYIATLPPRTPTRRPCSILLPNCQPLPTLGPILP